MDDIDHRILQCLQKDGRMSLKKIAEIVPLTPPAIAERIRKLEESGVITGYTAIVNTLKLEENVRAIINVTLPPERQDAFVECVRELEGVQWMHHVTGAFSMSIFAAFRNTGELERMVKTLQKFGRTQTLIVMSTPIPYALGGA
ncbi:AsnC family transcriptional regulator [Oscillibacter sp.]|uniref:Lrp/AsnC family transcriptional regulator n=1 Tax=Oscillibacter sp. TaxID=1945593 RepID=UPI00339746D4